ncbi:MAG: protein translocase subunit SecF [Polyangiaceae bacterium]
MELFKPGKVYDFMALRTYGIVLSFGLTIISAILLFYPGPNYGTDFRGGTEIEVGFKKDVKAEDVRKAVTKTGQFSEPDVVHVQDAQNPARFLIRVQEVSTVDSGTQETLKKALCLGSEDATACPPEARATEVKFSAGGDKLGVRYDAPPDIEKIRKQVESVPGVKLRVGQDNPQVVNPRDHRVEIQLQSKGDQLMDVLREQLGADVVPDHALRVEWVGPKAGKQLRDSARNAVAIAIVFIMLYLAFRFDMRFAPGVVIACVHDVLVVLGVFVVLRKEVTLSTIAAALTVVGYSMNDTVVVYDRIRENLGKHRGKSFGDIINLSVSETLGRTVLTSGATMLSVLAFFIWGTGVIKDFALAMVIGIFAGTYSSVGVAAPLTEWIDKKMGARKGAEAVKKRLRAKAT